MQRTYDEMMNLIMEKAGSDERIRAVTMEGSRANENAVHDEYSDFDICYYVTDIREFTNDKNWTDYFGEMLIMVDVSRLKAVSSSEYRQATRPTTARSVVSVDIRERKLNFKDHIDVRGMRAAEALEAVEDLVDDALMVGVSSVTILHGKGTGALKEEIRRYLRTVRDVATVADDHADRGGAGITIVTFKM